MTKLLSDEELRAMVLTEFKQVHRLAPADYTENCTNVVMGIFNTQKRLYAEQREANVRHDIASLAPICEHTIHDKDHKPYCGFINSIWQGWASRNGAIWKPESED